MIVKATPKDLTVKTTLTAVLHMDKGLTAENAAKRE